MSVKSKKIDDQTNEIFLQVVKKQKPGETKELIQVVKDKTGLSEKEIIALMTQLEDEETLRLTQKEEKLFSSSSKGYAFSKKVLWFWIIITLAFATLIAVFIIPENAYPIVYLRSILGISFVLFLPGYALTRALFCQKQPLETSNKDIDNIERFALSFSMSLVVTPFFGLMLNYSPWGITLVPITLSLLVFTLLFAATAVVREYFLSRMFSQQQNPELLS